VLRLAPEADHRLLDPVEPGDAQGDGSLVIKGSSILIREIFRDGDRLAVFWT
jgi:hypothetical protein